MRKVTLQVLSPLSASSHPEKEQTEAKEVQEATIPAPLLPLFALSLELLFEKFRRPVMLDGTPMTGESHTNKVVIHPASEPE